MNSYPDDPELEAWLRAMPLVPPSASLERRVLGPAGGRLWPRWAVAATMAAAAAVAGFVLLHRPPQPPAPDRAADTVAAPPAPAVTAAPQDVEETFSRVSYVGLHYLDDSTPVQEYHRESVRRVWKLDPAQGVETEQIVPVEEVVLVRADTL